MLATLAVCFEFTLSHTSLLYSVMESLDWSDDDDAEEIRVLASSYDDIPNSTSFSPRLARMELELSAVKAQLSQLRSIAQELAGVPGPTDAGPTSSSKTPTLSELVGGKRERDDDSHYFESYGYQGKSNDYSL